MSLPATDLSSPRVLIHAAQTQQWLEFRDPIQLLVAQHLSEVQPLVAQLEAASQAGLYAAGFFSYEAAGAFDPALANPLAPTSTTWQGSPDTSNFCPTWPLAWFGLYHQPEVVELPPAPQPAIALDWQPTIARERYSQAIAAIKAAIAAGLTYQVNYTLRLRSPFEVDPWAYFLQLQQAQAGQYGAFIDTDDWAICCASPELFFHRQGNQITCRPMKGTGARGLTLEQDEQQAAWLRASDKNQAENVMIVDMIRNDLGQVAEIGSVQVDQLFEVERYPTLWQMTSTVTAHTQVGLGTLLRSLFPCASITGAPKASTMRLIAQLEDSSRRIYTGSIGFITPSHPENPPPPSNQIKNNSLKVDLSQTKSSQTKSSQIKSSQTKLFQDQLFQTNQSQANLSQANLSQANLSQANLSQPNLSQSNSLQLDLKAPNSPPQTLLQGNQAQFNVAIRTVLVDKPHQLAEYGVGGGIVWDSQEADEYAECCTKAEVLTLQQPRFELLETLLWTPEFDYFLLDLHLSRLQNSARYFGFTFSPEAMIQQLRAIAPGFGTQPHRVRLRLAAAGQITLTAMAFDSIAPTQPVKVAIAQEPVQSSWVWLYHKTTHRQVYETARQSAPAGAEEVLLWNQRGELTEASIANLVVERQVDGKREWLTPPVQSGLLAGTYREWLLRQGKLREAVIRVADLAPGDRLWLINSVRQIYPAQLVTR